MSKADWLIRSFEQASSSLLSPLSTRRYASTAVAAAPLQVEASQGTHCSSHFLCCTRMLTRPLLPMSSQSTSTSARALTSTSMASFSLEKRPPSNTSSCSRRGPNLSGRRRSRGRSGISMATSESTTAVSSARLQTRGINGSCRTCPRRLLRLLLSIETLVSASLSSSPPCPTRGRRPAHSFEALGFLPFTPQSSILQIPNGR
jgi:hypothetical protein